MEAISVSVSPEAVGPIRQERIQQAHTPRRTQKFSASVQNDPANAGVTWAIAQGGGAISELGVFTPPIDFAIGKSTISATSVTDKSKTGFATVTYTDKPE